MSKKLKQTNNCRVFCPLSRPFSTSCSLFSPSSFPLSSFGLLSLPLSSFSFSPATLRRYPPIPSNLNSNLIEIQSPAVPLWLLGEPCGTTRGQRGSGGGPGGGSVLQSGSRGCKQRLWSHGRASETREERGGAGGQAGTVSWTLPPSSCWVLDGDYKIRCAIWLPHGNRLYWSQVGRG